MSDCVSCTELTRVWIELLNSTTKCVVSFAGLGLDVLNSYFKKEDCPDFDDGGGDEGYNNIGVSVAIGFGNVGGVVAAAGLGWGIRRWYIRHKYGELDDGVSVRFHPIEGFERQEPNAPSQLLLEPEPEPEPELEAVAAPASEPGPIVEPEPARYSCFGRLLKQRTFYQAGSPH